MMESAHTCNFSVPVPMVSSTPSGCCCTAVTGFLGAHCACPAVVKANSANCKNKNRIAADRNFSMVELKRLSFRINCRVVNSPEEYYSLP